MYNFISTQIVQHDTHWNEDTAIWWRSYVEIIRSFSLFTLQIPHKWRTFPQCVQNTSSNLNMDYIKITVAFCEVCLTSPQESNRSSDRVYCYSILPKHEHRTSLPYPGQLLL